MFKFLACLNILCFQSKFHAIFACRQGLDPIITWGEMTDLESKRVSSFAKAFGLSIVENGSVWQAGQTVSEVASRFGWGRYDVDLQNRVERGSRIEISFSHKYFKNIGAGNLRKIFRFSDNVLQIASSFLSGVQSECQVRIIPYQDGLSFKRSLSQGKSVAGVHLRRGDKMWEFDRFSEWSHGIGYVSRALTILEVIRYVHLSFKADKAPCYPWLPRSPYFRV